MNELRSRAMELAPMLKAIKDDLHRHPELSFQERRTTELIRRRLEALSISILDLGMETGVVGYLQGGRPGPTVALRADMDAIAQQEPADNGVVSETPGVMHACGHDFHTTCLLGAARLLSERREELAGNVVFLFQPAEEVTKGAKAMIEHGLWEKLPETPRFLFGLHTRPEIACGDVAIVPGGIMAGKTHFFIDLTGVTGHCGSPHKCVDVITCGAAIVNAIQTVVSRNTDPLEPLVCAVFSIHAGTPENFVPETLSMSGDIRAHSDAVMEATEKRLQQVVQGIAETYGCQWELRFAPQVPVTYNDPEMTALARTAAEAVAGPEHLVSPRGDMGSEDFAVLGQTVPAFFYWIGTGYPNQTNAAWHNARFRTDDDALPLGAALLASSVLTAMEQTPSL